jgi:hypothetical protein
MKTTLILPQNDQLQHHKSTKHQDELPVFPILAHHIASNFHNHPTLHPSHQLSSKPNIDLQLPLYNLRTLSVSSEECHRLEILTLCRTFRPSWDSQTLALNQHAEYQKPSPIQTQHITHLPGILETIRKEIAFSVMAILITHPLSCLAGLVLVKEPVPECHQMIQDRIMMMTSIQESLDEHLDILVIHHLQDATTQGTI